MRYKTLQLATLLPETALKSKNFNELLDYAKFLGFQSVFTETGKEKHILLRLGKKHATMLDLSDVLIALHLFAAQRHQDLVVAGRLDEQKFHHCLFGTLSIAKIRNWALHLQELAENRAA